MSGRNYGHTIRRDERRNRPFSDDVSHGYGNNSYGYGNNSYGPRYNTYGYGSSSNRYGNDSNSYGNNSYGYGNNSYGYGNYNRSSRYDEGAIKVSGINLCIRDNTLAHHTDQYDNTDSRVYDSSEMLVVRRGEPFRIQITFNRAYDPERDDVRLVFRFGNRERPSKHNYAELFLSSNSNGKQSWGSFMQAKDGKTVSMVVQAPPTCAVGKWSLKVNVMKAAPNSTPNASIYGHDDPIYILFNPWCKGDQVYMERQDLLDEYVLNEDGKIFRGSSSKISSLPWNFGQFANPVLDCVLYLLDVKSQLPDEARGDPVQVSRSISSVINSSDNSGVIVGNWSGSYGGGKSPLEWTGSVNIFNEYYKTKMPVKFAQCWVFSGLVTTACRTLGIPARSVTNFESAHDTDGSITIDTYLDSNHEEIKRGKNDSVWNFHVWNDVWFARPDLPRGYDGWQAVDATPQEASGGVYRLGPTSLNAIKYGDVDLPHDGPFVFAEVNGDKVTWMLMSKTERKAIKVDRAKIGKHISTKRPFAKPDRRRDQDREDITDQYKFKEGSKENHAAVQRAHLRSSTEGVHVNTEKDDVQYELSADNETFIGEPLRFYLKIKGSRTNQTRTVVGRINVTTVEYTRQRYKGVVRGTLPRTTLRGYDDEKTFYMEISVREYLDKLTDHCFLHISFSSTVEETGQQFSDTAEVRLRKPHLQIEAPDTGYIGRKFQAKVSFRNPLPVTLTNCVLTVEGPGFQQPVTYSLQGVVRPEQMFKCFVEFTPVKPGEKEIMMNFSCPQLYAVDGSSPIYINR